jgi:hypothetical protein
MQTHEATFPDNTPDLANIEALAPHPTPAGYRRVLDKMLRYYATIVPDAVREFRGHLAKSRRRHSLEELAPFEAFLTQALLALCWAQHSRYPAYVKELEMLFEWVRGGAKKKVSPSASEVAPAGGPLAEAETAPREP